MASVLSFSATGQSFTKEALKLSLNHSLIGTPLIFNTKEKLTLKKIIVIVVILLAVIGIVAFILFQMGKVRLRRRFWTV